ncbi:helix-turn-helix domain-containing protein [Mycolicibacterium fortuitum]|uniref:helix-turn-helix domain-containing protein n=1 Tax=Mycolicibacterium fortuitum TaxID=1766 RepID=UPI002608A6A9|nr:helix-turn-helix transcriptional regulator [Mycolicibacterium fortuitum]
MPKVRAAQMRNRDTFNTLVGSHAGARVTPTQLAQNVGITKAFVSMLRSGKRTKCSPEVATKIARELGVRVGVLFDPILSTTRHQDTAGKATQ